MCHYKSGLCFHSLHIWYKKSLYFQLSIMYIIYIVKANSCFVAADYLTLLFVLLISLEKKLPFFFFFSSSAG